MLLVLVGMTNNNKTFAFVVHLVNYNFFGTQKNRMPFFYRKKDPKEDAQPKIVENTKTSMIIRGKNTSETIKQVMSDFHLLRKPNSIKLNKKNDILPFENYESIEFLSQKNDCSLFVLGTHSKKRPHNLTMGRLFDYKMLDMLEFGVTDYKPMTTDTTQCSHLGSKPCILFQGSAFVNNDNMKIIQNLFLGTKFVVIYSHKKIFLEVKTPIESTFWVLIMPLF